MAGLATVFGSGAMTNTIEGIAKNDALFVIGSNTTETHPIIGTRMKAAVKSGAQLIVADPRQIPLCESASLHLQHRPGSDGALINAMCHVIIRDGLADQNFIDTHTKEYDAFATSVANCSPEWAEPICGVTADAIEKAAHLYAKADKAGIYYTMGITQHSSGTNNVLCLANLAMLTGNIGKEGAGLNPLRGQNNVQGSSDMACLPVYFPGYQRVDDDEARLRFEGLWQTRLSSHPGLTATEMTKAMCAGDISALWIMGENPVLSDPNSQHVLEAFEHLELLIVQDIFLTETAEYADVVLPAASFAEKNGTFTNTERKVQRIRKAVSPPGQAKDDLSIIQLLMNRMQFGFSREPFQGFSSFKGGSCGVPSPLMNAETVYKEIGQAWPAVRGITYERLEEGGIQWPCPSEEHPGTPILFTDGFLSDKASFTSVGWQGPKELPDAEYPFILTTGRVLHQYHTGTMTRKSAQIENGDRGPYVEIHPDDAAKLELQESEEVRAATRRGSITLPVKITDTVPVGIVFMPFHYKEAAANILTNDALDPISKIPEAKVCAVRIEKRGNF